MKTGDKYMKPVITFHLIIIFLFISSSTEGKTLFWNKGRGYSEFSFATPEGIVIDNTSSHIVKDWVITEDVAAQRVHLSFRAFNNHGNNLKRYPFVDTEGIIRKRSNPEWGFFLLTDNNDTISFTVKRTEKDDYPTSSAHTQIIIKYPKGKSSEIYSTSTDATDSHSGKNLWQIFVEDNRLYLSAGRRSQQRVADLYIAESPIIGFGFFASPAADLHVTDITYESEEKIINPIENFTEKEIEDYLNSGADAIEGYWAMFDRNLDEELLKPGGDYTFAIIKKEDGYTIYYVKGAMTNKAQWNTGRIKGFLNKTHFPDIFDVVWIDAEGNKLSNGIKAQIEDNEIMEIQFPYHSSSLRLRKFPAVK